MGHSEMLLAVAGLKPDEIETRTDAKLADGDWSEFPPASAWPSGSRDKLTAEPWPIDADGHAAPGRGRSAEQRALDLIWYVAWCNYMTRVADAFQLPLESTNVFAPPEPPVTR